LSSLIKSQGVGDLYELYLFSKKNGLDYNLAYIPGDFPDTSTQAFDPMSDMDPGLAGLLRWLSALIALPTVVYAGEPFFASAFAALKGRRLNMDVPISLAIILATGMSLYQTMLNNEQVYFDAAVTLLHFLLVGRYLDETLRVRTRGEARAAAERRLDAFQPAVGVEETAGEGLKRSGPLRRGTRGFGSMVWLGPRRRRRRGLVSERRRTPGALPFRGCHSRGRGRDRHGAEAPRLRCGAPVRRPYRRRRVHSAQSRHR
jgi:hypothetical protein